MNSTTNWDSIVYSSCSLFAGLFVFQSGAEVFTTHCEIIARRLGISDTLVTLLIAGAEWEEFAVVIASIIQHRSSIGLGNVIGSSTTNILCAFALSLLLYPESVIPFDISSKIYASALFIATSVFMLLAYDSMLDFTGGIFFLVLFGIYLSSTASGVFEGFLTALAVCNDDDEEEEETPNPDGLGISVFTSTLSVPGPGETSPLLSEITSDAERSPQGSRKRHYRFVWHLFMALLGFASFAISGYVLAHSASDLAYALQLSDFLVGMTILAFATTLPEKLHTLLSCFHGNSGMLVATTAGSNIFLLTLCLGVLFIAGGEGKDGKRFGKMLLGFEVWTAWLSSVVLVVIVFVGGRRWMGLVLLLLYAAFIAMEFTVYKR